MSDTKTLEEQLAKLTDKELEEVVKASHKGVNLKKYGLSSVLGAIGVGIAADCELSSRAVARIRKQFNLDKETPPVPAAKAESEPEWDEDENDGHSLRLSIGCMSFEVDLDRGSLTLETDIWQGNTGDEAQIARVRQFCADIVRMYNESERRLS